jgi:hypothetical protein
MVLRETADQIFPELAGRQRTFLLAGAAGLAAAVTSSGTSWTPATDRPFADVRLPSWL